MERPADERSGLDWSGAAGKGLESRGDERQGNVTGESITIFMERRGAAMTGEPRTGLEVTGHVGKGFEWIGKLMGESFYDFSRRARDGSGVVGRG
jgi:hypothetical protein